MLQETFTWFAAVDWGSEKHQGCVLDARGGIAGEREFSHSGAGLAELCDWILSIAGDTNVVGVAVEMPHGPVVDALLDRGFAVHAINPKQLDRLRDRFSVAGAKDDRRDAYASSSCASGRALPKSCRRNGCGSAIVDQRVAGDGTDADPSAARRQKRYAPVPLRGILDSACARLVAWQRYFALAGVGAMVQRSRNQLAAVSSASSSICG